MKSIPLLCFYLILTISGNAQPGALDLSFGNGGKVLTNVDQTRNVTNSVLVQPDGKIVVVGYCTPVDYTGYFTLVRYNEDGSLDHDFGLNGVVTTIINGNEDIAFSGVLQSDGKIIAAGYTWTGSSYDFAMVRYNIDGTRDLTFGANGIVEADFSGGYDKANQVLIEPDGSIVLVGYTGDGVFGEINMAFAKFHPDGGLDQSFGGDGLVVIAVSEPGLWESARAGAVQADGKIIAVGYTEKLDSANFNLDLIFAAVRLNEDGSLDQSFANGGILKMAIEKWAIGTAVAITEEGKIVVLLETKVTKYGTTDFTLLRLNALGTVDTSFGNNGFRTVSFDNSDDSGGSLLLQSDQKILAAGYTAVNNGSTVDFALARFDTNGNLDNTFGNGGKATVDFQGGLDFGGAIALQRDGKIVMAGSASVGNDFDFGLVRFENDVALPVTLISFEAKPDEEKVLLKWKTSSETQSDYFEIQRSTDGSHWSVLDTLGAMHYSSAEKDYSLTDQRPIKGKSFYRLKMIDFDGSFAYSSIVPVYFENGRSESGFSVYPNPTSGKLKLNQLAQSKIADVQIFDLKGNRNSGFRLQGQELDISSLVSGFYNIVVTDKEGRSESCKVLLAK